MDKYIFKSATELAELIRKGKARSVDIVKEHLNQIKKYNNTINAIIMLYEDEAIKTAIERDIEAMKGIFRGPLHGVPVTIKENFWIKGQKSTINAALHKNFVAPEDSILVERIKQSGAVILGKTNVPLFLLDYQVAGDIYPEGKNPYNTEYSPGGSTGGGAASLAAGFTPLELGSDFGGSIRVPSNFCGLYGLKPTDKTVPLHGNMPVLENTKTLISHMAQGGPLARKIEDLETLWKIIVGPHESDSSIPRIEWKMPVKQSLKDFKVAWIDGWPDYKVSDEISCAIRDFVEKISKKGCKIEKKFPDLKLHDDSLRLYMGTFPYVVAQGMPWYMRFLVKTQIKLTIAKGWTKHIPELNKGFKMGANHYGEMMKLKNDVSEGWENFFKEYDFFICPIGVGTAYKRTKIGTPLKYNGKSNPYLGYVWPYVACFNASGHPAMNIPLGLGLNGLPLGVQIVGPYWSEPELINFAKQAADLTEGFVRPANF